jgi:hypothetical protein
MSGSAVEAPNDQQQQPMLGKFDVAFGWLEVGHCMRGLPHSRQVFNPFPYHLFSAWVSPTRARAAGMD